jgi:bifunctional UDP-N-acetylglucosamine pyrophosphorylase/glucosamine-1-phosphate N-acetyltransferase
VTESRPAAVVVLAAGQGTRMRSAHPKVLHEIGGRSPLGHVLAAVAPLQAPHVAVVIGHGREAVDKYLAEIDPSATAVVQESQDGTGHAVRVALDALPRLDGTVVVVPGDAPLLTTATLAALLDEHAESAAAATLLTAHLVDPTGYGRVVRDDAGGVRAIVEERDADEQTRRIREVGTSVYAFDAALLHDALQRITTDNAQGEQYLTDVIEILVADGRGVGAHTVADADETLGVNDRVQLAHAGRVLRDRLVEAAMRAGATIVDPATTWLDAEVTVGRDVTIEPNTQLKGRTTLADGAVVGPNCTLTDTAVGEEARVVNTVAVGAVIGPQADVGPWTYLRPGTRLGARTKAGIFVEMKNAVVGDDTKVPHLTYVGDATIGERSNIGCATVFVNYDGVDKHHTSVGDDVRIGSDTMLVAPLRVGDGAYTAAGSVVTDEVPPGALAVARARQRNVVDWVLRRRAGTKSAAAARRAGAGGTMEAPSPSTTDQLPGENQP